MKPKRKEKSKYERLPARMRRIVEYMRGGQTLCKSLSQNELGETIVKFLFEPSGNRCQPKLAQEAIASGFLIANCDGLLGPESSQTFIAPPHD